ncbi:MAG TPA: serine hydrolase domain-containing protein [Longimicrobium sp.]|nr:serine hydrolase domain-containing protein [Longimicrobium sp.]
MHPLAGKLLRGSRYAPAAFALAAHLAGCAGATAVHHPGAALAARADSVLSRYEMYGLSGSVLVAHDGRTVLERGYGLADRRTGTPAAGDTRYDVASITKTFTAAAILRLAERGLLSPRDPISRFLGPVPADKEAVTVHHLLTHTAGFPLDPADAGITPAHTRAEFTARALAAPLRSPPGAEHRYSNLGYGLLAIVVERASGRSFHEFVTSELLGPAGLRATELLGDADLPTGPAYATGYLPGREDTLVAQPAVPRGGAESPSWGKHPMGAVGVVSTVGDLHRWLVALTGGRVLPDSLVRVMFTPYHGDEAYGWHVGTAPGVGRRVYRGGLRSGFAGLVSRYPDHGVTVVYLLNQATGWESVLRRDLERVAAGEPVPLPPPVVRLAPAALAALAGDYRFPGGARIRVWEEGGVLIAGAEGQTAASALSHPDVAAAPGHGALNDLAARVVAAAVQESPADSALARVDSAAALAAWLRQRTGPAPAAAAVLGTVPHPSGEGRAQTFVRLAPGGSVVRLIWQSGQVIAWGDGIRLPGLDRYRPTSASSAVAFRPREGVLRTLEFELDAAGAPRGVRVRWPGGEASALATRVESAHP